MRAQIPSAVILPSTTVHCPVKSVSCGSRPVIDNCPPIQNPDPSSPCPPSKSEARSAEHGFTPRSPRPEDRSRPKTIGRKRHLAGHPDLTHVTAGNGVDPVLIEESSYVMR